MTLNDLKTGIINILIFFVSFANIELILKIILLLVTIGFTINKWYYLRQNKKEND